jgi:hypothetical protein
MDGERFRTVREYTSERGHCVKIVDLEAVLPAYIVAELEAAEA